ncbi:MAG: helix-turn-helix domain-containing protein [Gammaproteobacteria bacterium]
MASHQCEPIIADRCEASDLDELAGEMDLWNIRFDQLSPGQFHGATSFIATPHVTAYLQQWNQRISARGRSPAGSLFIGAPVDAQGSAIFNGADLTPDHVIFAPPDQPAEFTTSDRARHVVLLVDPPAASSYLGEENLHKLFRGPSNRVTAPGLQRALVRTVLQHLDLAAWQGALLEEPGAALAIEHELLEVLAEHAGSDPRHQPGDSPSRRRAIIKHAVEYFECSLGPKTIPEVAEAIGVSQRSLEYAFKDAFGIPPVRYFRYLRMNKLRRYLLSADPACTTVTRTAARMGFTELGRLSGEYRRLFAETPVQTLKRHPRTALVRVPGPLGGDARTHSHG